MTATYPLSLEAPSIEALARDVQRVRDSVTDTEFARIVQRLASVGLSVRKIAALLDRPKSSVGRALKAPPRVDVVWANLPITVVYDVFYESGTNLLAAYEEMEASSADPAEADLWRERELELLRIRHDTEPSDRERLVALSEQWTDEAKRLSHA